MAVDKQPFSDPRMDRVTKARNGLCRQSNLGAILSSDSVIIIDAYNVIRHNPGLARFEDEKGTAALVKHFVNLCWNAMTENEHWVVVFDGEGVPENIFDIAKGKTLELFFSGEVKADDIIIDQARVASFKGKHIIIATSDYALYEPGIEKMTAFEFYDLLVSKPKFHIDSKFEKPALVSPTLIIVELKKAGHLSLEYAPDAETQLELKGIIEYYDDLLKEKANKAAKKVEAVLRKRTKVHPANDSYKQVNRTLKNLFRTFAEK